MRAPEISGANAKQRDNVPVGSDDIPGFRIRKRPEILRILLEPLLRIFQDFLIVWQILHK